MGSGINNKINEFLCNSKNVKKKKKHDKRLKKCYGHVNIATAFLIMPLTFTFSGLTNFFAYIR